MADEPGMDKAELRKLLAAAKKTPVNAALGMGKDGAPVLLLHKIKPPRALSKELDSKGDVKNLRWGEFFVDEEKDPKTLVARLNKPLTGLARRLVKIVKVAGFSKVVLQFEDGTTEEGGDEEGAEALPPDGVSPEPIAASADSAAAPAAAPTSEAAAPAPAAAPAGAEASSGAANPPPQQAADLGPITARVTTLVKRMLPLIAADASRGDTLKALAQQAGASIKGHDLEHAEAATNALEQAIAGFESAPPATDPATLAKARTAWMAVRQRIDGDLNKLLDAVRTTYQDHGALGEIEQRVQKELDGVLDALDDELAHKLDEMGKAAASERPKLAAEAKQIAERYQKHIATDKILGALDNNPFVPLSVQKTVTAALSAIVRTIH